MLIIFIAVVTLLVLFDQFTKYLAVARLKPVTTIPLIQDIFHFTYVENRGAAFGILQNQKWFFIVITMIILGAIIYYYKTLPMNTQYKWMRISLLLITAGAIGNLIDRVRQGFVIDFFDFRLINFAVFNVADTYVVIGTFLLAFLMLFIIKEEEQKEGK